MQDEGGRISAPLSLNSALWLKARLNSIDSEHYDNGSAGYDGDLSLLALGIDTALTPEWSLGLGFSYSKGDLDALSRSVESEGYALFGYSRYRQGSWYLNGPIASRPTIGRPHSMAASSQDWSSVPPRVVPLAQR